jgi:hypothetical protein
MVWGVLSWHGLVPLNLSEGKENANKYTAILSDCFQPMVKHFYPDGSGLFQDDNVPTHRARVVTEWFDEHENDVNHMS